MNRRGRQTVVVHVPRIPHSGLPATQCAPTLRGGNSCHGAWIDVMSVRPRQRCTPLRFIRLSAIRLSNITSRWNPPISYNRMGTAGWGQPDGDGRMCDRTCHERFAGCSRCLQHTFTASTTSESRTIEANRFSTDITDDSDCLTGFPAVCRSSKST